MGGHRRKKRAGLSQADLDEELQRQKANETRLGTENKGFRLMAKMGYSDGDGLGKNKQGIVDPLIAVKAGKRTGLGIAKATSSSSAKSDKAYAARKAIERMKEKERVIIDLQEDYRKRQSLLSLLRAATREMAKAAEQPELIPNLDKADKFAPNIASLEQRLQDRYRFLRDQYGIDMEAEDSEDDDCALDFQDF